MDTPEHYRQAWEADVGARLTIHSERIAKLESELSAMKVVLDTVKELREDVKTMRWQVASWAGGIAVFMALIELGLKFIK